MVRDKERKDVVGRAAAMLWRVALVRTPQAGAGGTSVAPTLLM